MDIYLRLPESLNQGENKATGQNIIQAFGEVFGQYIDLKMSANNSRWFENLTTKRQEYKVHKYDSHFLLKEILRHSDSPLRRLLPTQNDFYGKLDHIFEFRQYTAHNKYDGSKQLLVSTAQKMLDIFNDINDEIGMKLFEDLIKRFKDIESSKYLPNKSNQDEIRLLESKIAELQDSQMEISENLRNSESDSQSKDFEIVNLKNEIANLKKENNNLNSDSKLVSKLNDLESKLIALEDLSEKLNTQLINSNNQLDDYKSRERGLEEMLDLVKRLDSEQGSPAKQSGDDFIPGTKWAGEKGKTKFTLSPSSRTIMDSRTRKDVSANNLSEVQELIDDWLKIRPSGGRIFVDQNGVVTTLINEELIVLGICKPLI